MSEQCLEERTLSFSDGDRKPITTVTTQCYRLKGHAGLHALLFPHPLGKRDMA